MVFLDGELDRAATSKDFLLVRTEGRRRVRRAAAHYNLDAIISVGSGEILTIAFYAGRIAREPMMENPTIVVRTDRNDLDDQLFGTFSRSQDLLGQQPTQVENRTDLRANQ